MAAGADKLPLDQIRRRYVEKKRPLPHDVEAALRADPRAAARAILAAVEKRRHANRAEGQRLRHLFRFEQEVWATGVTRIAGVDEAGMSPLAGPVVAGAVILPVGWRHAGIDDSKKLDAQERDRLALQIKANAVAWGVGVVAPEEIDRLNIYWAGLLAMKRAVEALGITPEHLFIDARKLADVPIPQKSIVHGDALSFSIAAASIIAKTTRDAIMVELDRKHPGYGFARHKGYPVPEHYSALDRLGACPIHRRSFAPVRKALGLDPVQTEMFPLEPPCAERVSDGVSMQPLSDPVLLDGAAVQPPVEHVSGEAAMQASGAPAADA
ncbi:MAG TPA: ribonuclease HII [Candidatus Limnocylindrales bacterium]|nr:ribonuclease HII [Candidatus Limnocylindrales bacterium]